MLIEGWVTVTVKIKVDTQTKDNDSACEDLETEANEVIETLMEVDDVAFKDLDVQAGDYKVTGYEDPPSREDR